jgi:hypothetical protein
MGCGSSGSVSGKVYFHQKPLGGGTVTFASPGNKTVVSQIGPDGSFTIPKIPTGEVQIAVETESAKPSEERGGMRPPKEVDVPPEAQKSGIYAGKRPEGMTYVPIPSQYADPEKSGVTYTVESGSQEHDIKLPEDARPG